MMNCLLVMIGGGSGAMLRYLSGQLAGRFFSSGFPGGTLLVNSLGALLIGFLFNTFEALAFPLGPRLFLITGFLGGYTTFSSYALETARLFIQGDIKGAVLNGLLNNALSLVLVLAGMGLSWLVTGK